jgi:hypothetical protein
VKSSRCFKEIEKEHRFYFPGKEKDEELKEVVNLKEVSKPKTLRIIWKVLLGIAALACLGISVAYIIIPVRKFLDQDISSSVTLHSATQTKPIPFPGLQVCNFNWKTSIKRFKAYYIAPNAEPADLNFTITPMDDYGYDAFNCFEVNNHLPGNNLQIFSKRQKIVLVVEVPLAKGIEVSNEDCFPGLCDPDLLENATIKEIDPLHDAMGITLGTFAPNGVRREKFADDVAYISSASYTHVSLTYSRTFRFEKDEPEHNYKIQTTAVRYTPNGYAINFTKDGDSFHMDEVVFAEISFGELSFTEVNETKPYEAFNAFGDASAILGFFTGIGFPTIFGVLKTSSTNPCWSSLFYG